MLISYDSTRTKFREPGVYFGGTDCESWKLPVLVRLQHRFARVYNIPGARIFRLDGYAACASGTDYVSIGLGPENDWYTGKVDVQPNAAEILDMCPRSSKSSGT